MITKAGMEKIHKANQLLIDAKYSIIEAGIYAESMDDHIKLEAVSKIIQAGIKEILKTFYPKEEFDEAKWLKRRTSEDAEHDARVQKILDDSAQRQAESEEVFNVKDWLKLGTTTIGNSANLKDMLDSAAKSIEENETCDYDCKDCEGRIVVGDEEYCLAGEEMK
jgi:hypothetical protein